MSSNRRITPMAGSLMAFGSVTNAYTTLLGPVAGRGVILMISNSLNSDVWISLDGGTTDFIWLPAGAPFVLDLSSNNAEYSGTVSIKWLSAAPTAGSICAACVRVL